ncbi:MAG: hypothetical protein ACK57P_10885, partial [Planctomycetota bacterium]
LAAHSCIDGPVDPVAGHDAPAGTPRMANQPAALNSLLAILAEKAQAAERKSLPAVPVLRAERKLPAMPLPAAELKLLVATHAELRFTFALQFLTSSRA